MITTTQTSTQIVDEIFLLYEQFGNAEYIGEPISQLEHMSQAAALAMQQGYDDEVILAAFFHDIGHICVQHDQSNSMNGFGTVAHEKVGGRFLRSKGFSNRLASMVESHVSAKRYLTFKFPSYYDSLSDASRNTLLQQGGVMTADEARTFESDANFGIYIILRKWDEEAKVINVPIIDLNVLKKKAIGLLESEVPE